MKSLKAIIISSLILTSLLSGCGEFRNDEANNAEKTKTTKTDEKNDIEDVDEKNDTKITTVKIKDDDADKDSDSDKDDDKNGVKIKKGKVNVNVGGIKVDVNDDADDGEDRVKVDIGGGIKVNVSKDGEDVDVDLGDFNFNFDGSDFDLGDWSLNFDEKLVDENDYDFETDKNTSELGIDVNIGNINIKRSDDSKTHLALEYTIYADDDEACQDVRKHIKAVADTNGKKMEIKLVESKTGEDLDKWLRNNIPDCYVKYNFDLSVPSFINNINVEDNIGDITLAGLKGKINCSTNVGKVECSGMEFTDVSEISSKTGAVSVTDSKYNADTDIYTNTGELKFELPRSGSGKADITLSTKTGSIKVSGDSSYEIKNEKKKGMSHRMELVSEDCSISLSTNTGKIKINKD